MTGQPKGPGVSSTNPYQRRNVQSGGLPAEKQQSGDLLNPRQQSSRGLPPVKQQPGDLPNPRQQPGDLLNPRQQGSGSSSAKRPSGGLPASQQQPGPFAPINQPLGGAFPTQQQSGPLPALKPFGEMPTLRQPPAGRQQSGRLSSPSGMPRPAQAPIPPRASTSGIGSNTAFASDATLTKPAFEKNILHRMPTEKEVDPRQFSEQTWSPGANSPSMKNSVPNIPPLSQSPQARQPTDTLRQDLNYRQPQPLPPLSTSDTFAKDAQNRGVLRPTTVAQQLLNSAQSPVVKSNAQSLGARPLLPGVLLRGGRYRLQELLERQDWLSGVFEAIWVGKDSHRGGSQVMVCEVVLPENTSVMTQSILRTATMTLASVGRHPHIPTLWDAFSDQGRSFFVFEPMEGESLLSRMRHSGRTMAEAEVIECCLQMTEVLELLAQQSPPVVHGLIRPEHIFVGRSGPQFVLTSFSVVLAGGATQFVAGIDRSRLSPYTAPEFVRGVIDVRTDMYSLIATAYHAVTGSVPSGISGNIPSAQRINNNVSAEFDAILTKGLRAVANQRYQRPSELRQDLLALRSVSGTLVAGSSRDEADSGGVINLTHTMDTRNGQRTPYAAQHAPDTVAEALPILLNPTVVDDPNQESLLPRPEDLPDMNESNDMLNASALLGLILVVLIVIAVISQVNH